MGKGDWRRGSSRQPVWNDNHGPNNIGYKDEPFVLAKDVNQVFYVKDMSTKSKRGKNNNDPINETKRHIVLSGKRNIVGIEDKSDISEDYEKEFSLQIFVAYNNAKPSPRIFL